MKTGSTSGFQKCIENVYIIHTIRLGIDSGSRIWYQNIFLTSGERYINNPIPKVINLLVPGMVKLILRHQEALNLLENYIRP